MNTFLLEKRYQDLNSRLRIIMLQNVREESVNDESVLLEIRNITTELLNIKKAFNRLKVNPANRFRKTANTIVPAKISL